MGTALFYCDQLMCEMLILLCCLNTLMPHQYTQIIHVRTTACPQVISAEVCCKIVPKFVRGKFKRQATLQIIGKQPNGIPELLRKSIESHYLNKYELSFSVTSEF